MAIDPDTIAKARQIIAAASKPPYILGSIAGETPEEVKAVLAKMIDEGEGRCFTLVIPDG